MKNPVVFYCLYNLVTQIDYDRSIKVNCQITSSSELPIIDIDDIIGNKFYHKYLL